MKIKNYSVITLTYFQKSANGYKCATKYAQLFKTMQQ